MSVRVRVPASSANLGPGFDALGLALALYDVIDIDVTSGGLTVEVTGEGAGSVPRDESHLLVRAFRAASRHLGFTPPGLTIHCHNAIPQERGLGSSAAAIVAGIAAAHGLAGRKLGDDALQLAAELEGHADNVAPSLLGGLCLVWRDDRFHVLHLDPNPKLHPVMLIPAEHSTTATTRGLLPGHVPHIDAAFNAARCALVVQAMTHRPDLLLPATEDRLHQSYREPAYPATLRLVRALRAESYPATVSGAGPSVLVFTVDGTLAGVDLTGFTPHHLPIDRTGVTIERA
ncbi:MAG TPA: homoserine kinase [Actinophytocola sp.]|uniref:homoserine kinase n=1 Tax=Actinophytocola sp. TaxID=1872138 RepID=UPI002E039DBB|nr:homoserine kinase [Actinophytocola sp.]